MATYVYQYSDWPQFYWDNEAILPLLSEVRHLQGRLIGKMETLGFTIRSEAVLETITNDVLKTSEIEGENLRHDQVRSSIARKLGLEIAGLVKSDRNVDGVVEMMLDATQKFNKPLSSDRLFGWHSSLFPEGRSGMYKIVIGKWRDDSTGPMQVVSGAMGREKVHFQAPAAKVLNKEMTAFVKWFNSTRTMDPVLKASTAHLWFVTLHPFDDGNGRMARALTDMLLARADGHNQRFYSMSSQIRLERNKYYNILEKTQKGDMDVTNWHLWFLDCLYKALKASDKLLAGVLAKSNFWEKHKTTALNDRQRLLLNKAMDGFDGRLTSSKWAKIAKCSSDTALRDIQDLVTKKMLKKDSAGGRSTGYEVRL
ncbi:MAG: Fic family protein [Bacteroidetes bacterium]|nr:Fic family protein [Bacteroidota bacterium]